MGVFLTYFVNSILAQSGKEEEQKQTEEVSEQVSEDDWESEDESDEDSDGQLHSEIKFLEKEGYDDVMKDQYPAEDIKMVLVVRNDL